VAAAPNTAGIIKSNRGHRIIHTMWYRLIAVLGLLILGSGCADVTVPVAQPPQSGSTAVAHPTPALNPTVVAGDLPCVQTRHGCIPLNPDVTEDTIRQTICVPGYTETVRPSSGYSNGIKAKLLRESGLDESSMSEYELDHIVPLALGGHPRKLANLALQPWEGEHGAKQKDVLERRLQILVCRGEISLNEAQTCIAENWEACEAENLAR
jgi:hypothetical protein